MSTRATATSMATFQTTLDDTLAVRASPHSSSVRRTRSTLATSHEIRDRGSAFVGYVYRATTRAEARATIQAHHEAHARKEAYHTISAWRCMVVKEGRTGLGGPEEFEVEEGCGDGGERWGGRKILGVVQREGVMDAVVIVSRWYGGTMLGPARFTHIETCASEVCRRFKKIEEMEEYVQTLKTLDDLLAVLRTELAVTLKKAKADEDANLSTAVSDDAQGKNKTPDYRAMQESLDLTKARRLIHVRECAIKNTKILLAKYNTST